MKGKGRPKISKQLKCAIIDWIQKCDFVRISPCVNDTLLVHGNRVPKLLLEVSIPELHRELATSDVEGILDHIK